MKLSERVYVATSCIHGRGVFAKRRIQKDEYIGSYAGPAAKRNGKYVLWLTDADGREHGVRGLNLLRYLNHASRPNAYFDGVDLYAERVIKRDEEISFDYGWDDDDA
jgi:uncharacterized protein